MKHTACRRGGSAKWRELSAANRATRDVTFTTVHITLRVMLIGRNVCVSTDSIHGDRESWSRTARGTQLGPMLRDGRRIVVYNHFPQPGIVPLTLNLLSPFSHQRSPAIEFFPHQNVRVRSPQGAKR